MYDIDEIGGARIGFGRVTWPFAKLLVNRNELRINASIIGNVYFRASDIISIEPSSVFAGDGIKVNHRVHGYSRKVIFLTFGSRDLIKRIENTGFLNNPSPIPAEVEDRILKYQSSGSFPMKWSVVIGLAIIWNFLFLGDQLGYFCTVKSNRIFIGKGGQAALAFVFLFALSILLSKRFSRLVLKDGRTPGEIRSFLLFVMLITGIIFTIGSLIMH